MKLFSAFSPRTFFANLNSHDLRVQRSLMSPAIGAFIFATVAVFSVNAQETEAVVESSVEATAEVAVAAVAAVEIEVETLAADPQPVAEKAVLITGATSGLGLRMTEVLSQNGFIVYAGGRDQDDLDRLEAMDNVEAIRLDVTSTADMQAAVKLVEAKGRGLHGLINNAGLSIFGPMTEVPYAQVEFLFDVNVLGPYRVTQAFAPLLVQSQGRLFTTGSIAGSGTSMMMGHYSMSKHAVEAMVDAWHNELTPAGVTVGVVEPGAFASNIGNAALERLEELNYWSEDTAYAQAREQYFQGLAQVDQGADPLPVAQAALDFMSSETPKVRYMVTPNADSAQRIISKLLNRVAQQNHDHAHSLDRATLIEMLDAELEKQRPVDQ